MFLPLLPASGLQILLSLFWSRLEISRFVSILSLSPFSLLSLHLYSPFLSLFLTPSLADFTHTSSLSNQCHCYSHYHYQCPYTIIRSLLYIYHCHHYHSLCFSVITSLLLLTLALSLSSLSCYYLNHYNSLPCYYY